MADTEPSPTRRADLDGDGDLDLVASNDRPDQKLVYHNDGTSGFRVAGTCGAPEWSTRYVTVADVNGDQRPDLLVANRSGGTTNDQPSFVCLTDGQGGFPACTPLATPSATIIVAVDLDGDGPMDLFVPHRDGGRNLVFWNDGTGRFAAPPVAIGPAPSAIFAAAAADLDADGTVDVVVGDEQTGLFLSLGTGARSFAEPQALDRAPGLPYAITIADLDRDGTPDIVVGKAGAPAVILFNQGKGKPLQFAAVPWNDGMGAVCGVAIGDLDGDGWPDIAAARSDAPNGIWFSGAGVRGAVRRP